MKNEIQARTFILQYNRVQFNQNDAKLNQNLLPTSCFILAYQIRKSEVFAWDRNSYLTHVISPRRSAGKIHVQLVSMIPGNVKV